jgi:transcriptional regulator with XRE-family HTH domain
LKAEQALSKEKLRTANVRLTEQAKTLETLKQTSMKQEELLQKTNISLQTYAKEEKATRLRIKAQRNAWEAATGVSLLALLFFL